MNRILCFFILIVLFSGCAASFGNKKRFVTYRNYDVGRSADWSYEKPSQITSYNLVQDKYFYESDGGCQWVYYVNKKTKIVESWEYFSSQDKCSLGIDWFKP